MDNKECITDVTLDTQNPGYKFSTGVCFCVSLAQNMNDKRSGCLEIVHAHTGLQVDTGVYQKTTPSENVGLITQNVQYFRLNLPETCGFLPAKGRMLRRTSQYQR